MGWIGYTAGTLNDGTTDLSMAAFFPYLLMDGMNEKGLAMSVLKLRGDPTLQDTGKNKISTTVALRLVLDRAATVDEALALLDRVRYAVLHAGGQFPFSAGGRLG